MFSIKLIVGFAVLACVYAEPPRKRFNFRFGARQEVDDAAAAENPPASQGYNYEAPKERLSLPIKFRQFARQEEASSGYNYPKPTNGYGVPGESEETTDAPTTEYGAPEAGTDSNEDSSTDNPAAESLRGVQAANLRRKNAKLSRNPSARLISGDAQFQRQVQFQNQVQFQQQVQPVVIQEQPAVYYVQYPSADFVDPQYYYIFKK